MSRLTRDLEVCGDCALIIANGDGTDEHGERMVAVWGEGVSGVLGLSLDHTALSEHFSWAPCDGCGERLGGDRFPASHYGQV